MVLKNPFEDKKKKVSHNKLLRRELSGVTEVLNSEEDGNVADEHENDISKWIPESKASIVNRLPVSKVRLQALKSSKFSSVAGVSRKDAFSESAFSNFFGTDAH